MSVHAANNDGLEVLDLSWNHLRMKGAVAFCAGLKVRPHTQYSGPYGCNMGHTTHSLNFDAFSCLGVCDIDKFWDFLDDDILLLCWFMKFMKNLNNYVTEQPNVILSVCTGFIF